MGRQNRRIFGDGAPPPQYEVRATLADDRGRKLNVDEQPRYTHVAAQAVGLAERFEERFSAGLDGPVTFRVQLASPEGPSTGGGKQVVQPIKLVPADGGPTIVIGAANTVKQMAELRSYALVSEQYGLRFKGAQLPIHAGSYRQLLADFTRFFHELNLSVTTADTSRSLRPPPAPPSSRHGLGVIVALAVSVGVLVIAAWIVLSHLHR